MIELRRLREPLRAQRVATCTLALLPAMPLLTTPSKLWQGLRFSSWPGDPCFVLLPLLCRLPRAGRAFDPEGKGWIDAEVLRSVLSSKGSEPLSADELTKMMGCAADEQGRVYYEDYCQKTANDGRTI